MQIALHNSKLTLLLPKSYERVGNGASLYPEMYQKRKAEDVEMFQSLSSSSYGNIVIAHINLADSMRFGDKAALLILVAFQIVEIAQAELGALYQHHCAVGVRKAHPQHIVRLAARRAGHAEKEQCAKYKKGKQAAKKPGIPGDIRLFRLFSIQ